jgi:hypothetical protein
VSAATFKPGGKIIGARGAARSREKLSARELADQKKLLDFLNRLQDDNARVDRAIAGGRVEAIAFEDLRVGDYTMDQVAGTVAVRHALGRRVRWAVVDWIPATEGEVHVLQRDADRTTDEVLALRSYVPGTLTLEVW